MDLTNWQQKSISKSKVYKKYLGSVKKKEIIRKLPDLHSEAFSKIDCLDCAQCCKNYSPRFKQPDIRRISKHMKITESNFIAKYLKMDQDGDYVVTQKPCPFLGEDNFCGIYDVRPSDCSRFPYTDEDVLIDRPGITLKNSTFCPAVFFVLERLLEIR